MAYQISLGRVAIVTGAAQGIGRAIALRLAQDGYNVAANDLDSNTAALESLAEEIKSIGRNVITVTGDVGQEIDVQILVDRTVTELGELHVMVANAGIANIPTPIISTSLESWDRIMLVNTTGTFLCYRAAARQMLKQGHGGRIVGASSASGKRGTEGLGLYSATKFAVRGLTQALASELAKEGITVNAYAPGAIDTPLLWGTDRGLSIAEGIPEGSFVQMIRNATPMGKCGTPENVAALVSYIVSDEADFMTGQTLSLNGGSFYD